MRFLFRSLSGLFITALTFGLLFLAGFQLWQAVQGGDGEGRGAQRGGEPVQTVRLLELTRQRIQPVIEVHGLVGSRRSLELRATATGRIVALGPNMHEGGKVRAGEVLVQLDPSTAQAALDSRIAARDDAQASLADAQRMVEVAVQDLAAAERQAELRRAALQRQNELAERGLGTRSERETAELAASAAEQAVIAARSALASRQADVSAARNALRRAEIDLAEARRDLDDTRIRAGFDGLITDVTAVEGGLVGLNEKLGQLIDPDLLEVSIPLSLEQYARLATGRNSPTGTPVTVLLEGSAGAFEARAEIDREAASVAQGSAGRVVYARILDPDVPMRPGDFVRLRITEPPLADVARVPGLAIGVDGTVLVAGEQGRLTARPVRVLRRQDDAVIIAVPDELAGARIVAERRPQLGEGIRVRDADAPAQPDPSVQDQRAQNRKAPGNG